MTCPLSEDRSVWASDQSEPSRISLRCPPEVALGLLLPIEHLEQSDLNLCCTGRFIGFGVSLGRSIE